MLRARIALVGAIVTVAFWFLAGIFDLNGSQWDWWSQGAGLASWVALLVTVVAAIRARGPLHRPRRWQVAAILVGAATVAASAFVMARRYSDPYLGSLVWPHVLACLAAAGLAVVAGVLGSGLRGSAPGR